MENPSPKGKLNWEDAKQIAIKLLMFIAAAAIPEIVKELVKIDFGQYQFVASAIIFGLTYTGQRLGKGK